MIETATTSSPAVADLAGGPYDLEFFFDPICPFAWQTSVWLRRVAELRDLRVGWRFISLRFINETKDLPASTRESQMRGVRYHRICAAARDRLGNDAVGELYRAYGERYWYTPPEGTGPERVAGAVARVEPSAILSELRFPADLAAEADNDAWDALIRAESDEGLRRTGPDVGTPIITYGPPEGTSMFGPVISDAPGEAAALAIYDAVRTLVDHPGFAELKRTNRPPVDLPLLAR